MNRMIFPAVLAAALLGNVVNFGHAGEPQCQQCEVGVPILSKIPYVGRLFKNVAVADDSVTFERIGVDFDFQISEAGELPAPRSTSPCQAGQCQPAQCQAAQCQTVKCEGGQCRTITFTHPAMVRTCTGPACQTTNFTAACAGPACSTAACAGPDCTGPGCPDAVCSTANCANCPSGVCCPPPGHPGVGSHAILAEVEMQSNMLQMYGEFLEEIDTLRSKLDDEKQELTEALFATSVENAKLTAQLEASKETTKLAVENAVLKEKLAVATGVTPGNQQLAKKLAKKNAALQAKIEKLESQVAEFAKTKVEVAEKTSTKKK